MNDLCRKVTLVSIAIACFYVVPNVAIAQSAIAGVVRDASGAVLPGVTVEASSPALIEKVRSVTTDAEGNYKLIDLRPGLYSVTFSLTGFNSVKRGGIDLPGSFTATVNAELAVGSVNETVTVTSSSPVVDVQSATSQQLVSKDTFEAIPTTSKSPQGFAGLIPGVTGQGLGTIPGGVNDLQTAIHGAAASEAVFLVDGMNTASAQTLGGGGNVFRIAHSYVQEVNFVTGGGMAEQPLAGLVTNVIPKEGGNAFVGSFYGEYSNSSLTASNLTDALTAQGFTSNSLSNLVTLWDSSAAVGGPILRDQLWFFTSYRNAGSDQTRAGIYDNLTPLGWSYTPNLNRPALAKLTQTSENARLTWQVSPRNKVSLFADFAPQILNERGYTSNLPISPEATNYSPYIPNAFFTASWKAPVTNRLLLSASVVRIQTDFAQRRQTPDTCQCSAPAVGLDVVSAIESTTSTMFRAGSTAQGSAGTNNYGHFAPSSFDYAASASYVTGSHAAKVGINLRHGKMWFTEDPNLGRAYTLRNAAPISLTEYATPLQYENDIAADVGFYAQDVWTYRRMTLTGGLRFDYLNMSSAPEDLPAGPFVLERVFPSVPEARWKDVNPRFGIAYDLFGDGKTALKASLGRYIIGQGAGNLGINANNPVIRSVTSVTRTWNDLNHDYVPDCNLLNPLANGECGQISNLNFGQNNPNATFYDNELINGLRNYTWETTAEVQRQLASRVGVSFGYYHRKFGNFTTSDNLLVTPADYSPYCITAPVDSRLPGGGGNQICGLYDVSPALFGKNQTEVRSSSNYGTQTQTYDGFDITGNARLRGGVILSGGVDMGRTHTSTCFVVDSPGALRFCDVNPPFQPNVSLLGSYPLPWWGLVTSATYRDYPGVAIAASYLATNAQIVPSLGRNLSSGATGTVSIPLIAPSSEFLDRQRQVDLRLTKRLAIGRFKMLANADLYNLFNATGIQAVNTTFGPNWLRPTQLQEGRYLKIGGQFDF
jgi:hypothetical protein